jgi:hypothetical protein
MTAVGELFLEALADEEAVVGIDGQVASIEEGVEIRAKEKSVANLMPSPVCVGPDVGGLENRKGLLFGHRAPTAIGIQHGHPEA